MSKSNANNLWLVIGAWSLGVMVSAVVFLTVFDKPIEKIEDVNYEIRLLRWIIIVNLLLLMVGLFYVGYRGFH